MDREAPMAALLAQAITAAGFVTTGRLLKHWTEVEAQPALYVVDAEEVFGDTSINMPRPITMAAELWVYTKGTERPDIEIPAALNALLDAIETVLQPSAVDGQQRLGGVVEHCWIEGRIEKSPGHITGQAVAVIPVIMLVPR